MGRKGAAVAGVVSFSKAVLFALYVGLLFYVSKSLKDGHDESQCTSSKSACSPHRRTFKVKARSLPLPLPPPQVPGSDNPSQLPKIQQRLTPADSPRNIPQQEENSDGSASELVSSTTQTSSLVYKTKFAESSSTSEQASSTSFGAEGQIAIKRERPRGRKRKKRSTAAAPVAAGNEDSTICDISIITHDSTDTLQDIDQDISELGSTPVHTQSCCEHARTSQSLKQLKDTKHHGTGDNQLLHSASCKKAGINPNKKSRKSSRGKEIGGGPVISKDHLHQQSSSASKAFKERVINSTSTSINKTAGEKYLQCRFTSSASNLNERQVSPREDHSLTPIARERDFPVNKSTISSKALGQVLEKQSLQPPLCSKGDTDSKKLNSAKKCSTCSVAVQDQSLASKNPSDEFSKPSKPSKHRVVEEIPSLTTNQIQNRNSNTNTAPPKVETLTIRRGLCLLKIDKDDSASHEDSEESLALSAIETHSSQGLLIEDTSPVRQSPLIQELSELLDKDFHQATDNFMIVREAAARDLLFGDSETNSARSSCNDGFQRRALIGEISPEKSRVSETKGKQLIEEISSAHDVIQSSIDTESDKVVEPSTLVTTGHNKNLTTTINHSALHDVNKPSCSMQDKRETNSCLASTGIQIICTPCEKLSHDKTLHKLSTTEENSSGKACVTRPKVRDYKILQKIDNKLSTAEEIVQASVPHQQVSEEVGNGKILQEKDDKLSIVEDKVQSCDPLVNEVVGKCKISTVEKSIQACVFQADEEVGNCKISQEDDKVSTAEETVQACVPHQEVGVGNDKILQDDDRLYTAEEKAQAHDPRKQVNKQVRNGRTLQERDNRPSTSEKGIQEDTPYQQSEKVGSGKILQEVDDRRHSIMERGNRNAAEHESSLSNAVAVRNDKSIQANFDDDDSEKDDCVMDKHSRWKIMLKNNRRRGLRVNFKDVRRSLASLTPPNLDCISEEEESSGSENSPRLSLYHACHNRSKEVLGDEGLVAEQGSWYSCSKEKMEDGHSVAKNGSWYS